MAYRDNQRKLCLVFAFLSCIFFDFTHCTMCPAVEPPPTVSHATVHVEHLQEPSLHSGPVDPEIKKICDATDYSELCIATVVPLLQGHDKHDVLAVLEVAIRATDKFAKFTTDLFKKFAESPLVSDDIKPAVDQCKDSFDFVIDNFDRTLEAFNSHDIGTMNTMLSAVITDISDCQDAFVEAGSDTPLLKQAVTLTNMTSNCLAIVSLVK